MQEIWKEVWVFRNIDFKWLYQVSNLWRVKSMARKCGFVYKKERVLNPTENKKRWWYFYVSMQIDWKRINVLLHRIIAFCFIENINNKPQINHIDWNKSNNSVENLEWVSDKENKAHAIRNWLSSHLKEWYSSKLYKKIYKKSLSWEILWEYNWLRDLCEKENI